jgi:hypothetical protein
MKLILHIGTHKTGTTAVQRFLYANRRPLAACRFHYATPPHGLEHANAVANALNTGDSRAVHTFLAKHVKCARRRGADTILVSAENFYAMTVLASMQQRQLCPNALEHERDLIETVGALVPEDITTSQIVCYFRRPDRYAESLYNQHVKRGISFDGTFDEFVRIIEPALFYNRHMRLWSDVFGQRNCVVRLYDSVRADVVGDFVANVLGIQDVTQFSHVHEQANERVGRDLLEFKRLKNRAARFSERDIERTILRLVDEEMELRRREPDSYQDLLSPNDRAELLRRLRPEMEALQASHDVPRFPVFDLEGAKATWRPYPGLGQERRKEIELHYRRINRRVAFRLERLVLRSASALRRSVPVTGVLLDVLKKVGAKRALHGFAMGLQRGSG